MPAAIKTAGVLNIASDASYAPNEFFDTDGKTIIGMDVDLGKAIAAKLGLKANFQNVTFDNIIPGLAGGKYDLGMSSFTDTKDREKTVDFVTYFSAGESLIVPKGNPKGVTGPDLSLCGLTIAVEKGTTERARFLHCRRHARMPARAPSKHSRAMTRTPPTSHSRADGPMSAPPTRRSPSTQ